MSTAAPADALVLFGATGDLAYKKIFPALYAMVRRGHLDVPLKGEGECQRGKPNNRLVLSVVFRYSHGTTRTSRRKARCKFWSLTEEVAKPGQARIFFGGASAPLMDQVGSQNLPVLGLECLDGRRELGPNRTVDLATSRH